MSRQIYGSLCYNIEGRKQEQPNFFVIYSILLHLSEEIPSLHFFFTFHPVSHATVDAAFTPVPLLRVSPSPKLPDVCKYDSC